MSDAEFLRRITAVERYVAKVGFLCPKGCRDWWHHAEATVGYLSECVEAQYYGVERPPLETGIGHLDADIARHLAHLDRKWEIDMALEDIICRLRSMELTEAEGLALIAAVQSRVRK